MALRLTLLVGGLLVFIAGILAGLYFFMPKSGVIAVRNSSDYFTITKQNTRILEYYLHEWGVWKKDMVTASRTPGVHTVRNIIVELTDEQQDTMIVADQSIPPLVQSGASTYIDKDGALLVKIYLNRNILEGMSAENMNKNFTYLLVSQLHESTSAERAKKNESVTSSAVNAAVTAFFDDPGIRPFVVASGRQK